MWGTICPGLHAIAKIANFSTEKTSPRRQDLRFLEKSQRSVMKIFVSELLMIIKFGNLYYPCKVKTVKRENEVL